jgi:hypothetical protein
MPKVLLTIALCVLVSGVLLSGCMTAAKKPPAKQTTEKPYRLESEGDVPPLAETDIEREVDRAETFEELSVTEDAVVVENVEPPPVDMPVQTQETGRKTMDGYRVQVMASANKEAAESVKTVVSSELGVPAYVDFVDGVYKVRVGDCPTRADAEALRDICRRSGYADAWIVSGKIFMPERADGR